MPPPDIPEYQVQEMIAWLSIQAHGGFPVFAVTMDSHGISQTGDPDTFVLGLQISVQYPVGGLFVTEEERVHLKSLLGPVLDYIEVRVKEVVRRAQEGSK